MSSPSADDDRGRVAAEQLVESRMRLARQDEIVAIYEDLLVTIWNRITPTLGRVTVTAILERSIADTAARYPFVGAIAVARDGVSFNEVRHQLGGIDQEAIREGFKELIANLIDVLAVLTGDIIVRQLLRDVGGER
jgi:hypothetical protein